MNKKILIVKGILFGIIGAIAGAVPNALIKSLMYFSGAGEYCLSSTIHIKKLDIVITPCGIIFSPIQLMPYFLILLIGGALFGFLGMLWGYRIAQKKGSTIRPGGWKGSFWWSFLGGFVYNLIFITLDPGM